MRVDDDVGVESCSEKGMSTMGHFWEQTPFWPWREENLSPMTGLRGILKLDVDALQGCFPSVIPNETDFLDVCILEGLVPSPLDTSPSSHR